MLRRIKEDEHWITYFDDVSGYTITCRRLPEEYLKQTKHDNMKTRVEQLRLEIDEVITLAGTLEVRSSENIDGEEFTFVSDDIYESIKSLKKAKAWAGFLVGELGGTSPYSNEGKRKNAEDIQATDAVSDAASLGEELTYIEQIDHIRGLIEDLRRTVRYIDEVKEGDIRQGIREEAICRTNIWNHLTEAKMHLGFELGYIRDAEDAKK